MKNFFTWYFDLFANPDVKVAIAAWGATITTLTFLLTFIIKPFRLWVIKKLSSLFNKSNNDFSNVRIKYPSSDLKYNLKLIIVDDDNIFPVEGFREFGYNISKWDLLNESRLKQLREGLFDIIVLDIIGVAKDIAENDGLDVLQDIKDHNPAQVIIAYSGQSFDILKNKFWELADEKLGKPTPFISTQKVIDSLIEKTFTIDYFINKIKSFLEEDKEAKLVAVKEVFYKYRVTNSEPNWQSELEKLSIKGDSKQKIASILKKFYSLTKIEK